jgi:hypothetical protein
VRFLHLFKFGLVVLEKSNSSRRRQAIVRFPAVLFCCPPYPCHLAISPSGHCSRLRQLLRISAAISSHVGARPDRGRFPASIPSCRFRPTAAVPPLRCRWSRRSPRKPPCTIAGGTISSRSAAMFEGRGPSGRDVACHI